MIARPMLQPTDLGSIQANAHHPDYDCGDAPISNQDYQQSTPINVQGTRMAIPDYQTLMLPVLTISTTEEARFGDVVEKLAGQLGLTPEEKAELLPSGRQTLFNNRVHWAKTYLVKAGLLENTRRG